MTESEAVTPNNMVVISLVKANAPTRRFHILLGAKAHVSDARSPRLHSCFLEERSLLPKNRGGGGTKLGSINLG